MPNASIEACRRPEGMDSEPVRPRLGPDYGPVVLQNPDFRHYLATDEFI